MGCKKKVVSAWVFFFLFCFILCFPFCKSYSVKNRKQGNSGKRNNAMADDDVGFKSIDTNSVQFYLSCTKSQNQQLPQDTLR